MHFPVVSEELICSIREQVARCKANNKMYYEDIFNEMEEENKYLHDAIISTTKMFYEAVDMDVNDPHTYYIVNNMLNMCACVYQSIKQQMVCDELKNA